MAHVVVVESLNEDIFVCGMCKSVYNSLSLFLEHKTLCRKGVDILRATSSDAVLGTGIGHFQKSTITNKETPIDNNGKVRLPSHHNAIQTAINPYSTDTTDISINCSVCSKSFNSRKSLNAHIRSHKKPSQCPLCGRCFIYNSHLKRHLMTHKVWPNGLNETTPKSLGVDITSYSCPYCASVLANYGQFRAHLNSHISLKKFRCMQGECNSFFETVKEIVNHTSQCHEVTNFTCHICKKVFHNLEEISIHYQNHAEGNIDTCQNKSPQYKCKQCDAVFRKPEKLSLHMLTENHKKVCIHCNKTFVSDKRLRMHLQIHQQSKPYKCNVCGESFHMKKYLNSHSVKHGNGQYPCNICKQTFKRQDILQRHKKTHMPNNSLKCPFKDAEGCVKEFTRKDKLKEHLRSHSKVINTPVEKELANSKHAGTMEICIVPLDSSSK